MNTIEKTVPMNEELVVSEVQELNSSNYQPLMPDAEFAAAVARMMSTFRAEIRNQNHLEHLKRKKKRKEARASRTRNRKRGK